MKRRIIAIILTAALLISAFSAAACAADATHYREIDYSTAITPGTPVTGVMTLATPALIAFTSTGVAKGFTVTLEEGKEYVFSFKAVADDALLCTANKVVHAINIMVLNNVMQGVLARDILSLPVILTQVGKTAATSVRFKAPSSGQFRVLITEGSLVVDDYKLNNINYTVSVDELVWNEKAISSAAEFNALRDEINSFNITTANLDVELTADIDMGNANWAGFKCFAGKLDGNGYTISNFGLGTTSLDNNGVLGKVMGGAEVEDVKIAGINSTGAACVGALAGTVENSSVENCSSAGAVSGLATVGGLIGTAVSSEISDCTSSCAVTGGAATGGLVGAAVTSKFSDCSATGTVKGGAGSGGFSGTFSGTAADECFSTGAVSAAAGSGGFVGTMTGVNTITNCYSKSNIVPALIPSAGVGGFAGAVTIGNSRIINCYSIGTINAFAETIGGFLASCDETSAVTISNCYTASKIATTNGSANKYGTFIANASGNVTITGCFASNAPVTVKNLSINALPGALGVTAVDFADSKAVSDMTAQLNKLPANDDNYDVWTGTNAANGPDLSFEDIDVPVPGDSIEDTLEWVKSQNIILQIPLYIFYVPIMYIISLFKGL